MNPWDRFVNDMGAAAQIFVVGPMLKGSFVPHGPTVYVDGGIHARGRAARDTTFPTISVGDGDSASEALDINLSPDKNYSDLAFVLHKLPPTVRHVELLGFLGGRRGHELANFGEVHAFLKGRNEFTTVRFDQEVIAFTGGILKMKIEGIFGVMVLDACSVTITGACKYAAEKPLALLPLSSHGISNLGHGNVLFTADKPAFIFIS